MSSGRPQRLSAVSYSAVRPSRPPASAPRNSRPAPPRREPVSPPAEGNGKQEMVDKAPGRAYSTFETYPGGASFSDDEKAVLLALGEDTLHPDELAEAAGIPARRVLSALTILEMRGVVPAVNQVECHPLLPQNDLLDFCRKNNVAMMAYSPLGSRQKGAQNVLENPAVMKIAEKLQASPAQVVLAWQLQRGVSVIPKSVHEARLRENFAAQVLKLDDEDMAELSGLQPMRRFISGAGFMLPETGYDNLWDEKG